MTDDFLPPGRLDIGRVIGGTFGVIGRHFPTYAVLSLILAGGPLLLISLIQGQAVHGDVLDREIFFDLDPLQAFWAAFGGLAAIVFGAILQGALIYATVQDMNGQRPSVHESLATGLREFMPLIGVSILLGIAIVVGMCFLIVPGVILGLMWCVAVPCLIAENTSVTGAFDRSADLTRGNRWRIFGLVVITWLAFTVVGSIFGAMNFAPRPFHRDPFDYLDLLDSPVFIIGNLILKTATAMVASTGIAVLYVELRKAREAHGSTWLSEIF